MAVGSSTEIKASFAPSAISAAWSKYLSSYEENNDRFGRVQFLSKDASMVPDHLAVAVWIEDEVTHRVLDSAFTQLMGER